MKNKYLIYTYGCQMNYSDTERMETYLEAMGFEKTKEEKDADLIIFNTCSIRKKAEDRVFGKMPDMSRLKKTNPDLIVAITGCMTRISSSRNSEEKDRLLKVIKDLDIVLKIDELPKLAGLLRELNLDADYKAIEEEELEQYFKINATYSQTMPKQAFIPISKGCDKFCTYCIVPYSRGREQSRSLTEILKEAEDVVNKGFVEITLLGQTVNSYGLSVYDKIHKSYADAPIPEGKEPFVFLLEELDKLKEKGLRRVRWTSPHPRDMSDQLIDAMADLETQMPHLHLPIQSGDDVMLKRMNRSYTTEKYRYVVERLRKKIPDISISTDIIVGFSDESEEEFQNTYDFFKEMNFEHAYLAQYSERKGTFADKNLDDNVSKKIKKERWNKLNDLLRELSTQALKRFEGRTCNVLIEAMHNDKLVGKNENFKIIKIPIKDINNPESLLGQIIPVKITQAREWELSAEIVS